MRYIGTDPAAADQVQRELDFLRAERRAEKLLEQQMRAARAMLRMAKRQLAPLLRARGYHYHGYAVRKSRFVRTAKQVDQQRRGFLFDGSQNSSREKWNDKRPEYGSTLPFGGERPNSISTWRDPSRSSAEEDRSRARIRGRCFGTGRPDRSLFGGNDGRFHGNGYPTQRSDSDQVGNRCTNARATPKGSRCDRLEPEGGSANRPPTPASKSGTRAEESVGDLVLPRDSKLTERGFGRLIPTLPAKALLARDGSRAPPLRSVATVRKWSVCQHMCPRPVRWPRIVSQV